MQNGLVTIIAVAGAGDASKEICSVSSFSLRAVEKAQERRRSTRGTEDDGATVAKDGPRSLIPSAARRGSLAFIRP